MSIKKISEFAYAPVHIRSGKKLVLDARYIHATKSAMIDHIEREFYGGNHDWKYFRRLGWRAVKIKITGAVNG